MKEIAEKLGAKAGNISVWFSTTGKKLTTKVEPGRYAVKGTKPLVVAEASVAIPAKAAIVKKAAKRGRKVSKSESVASVAKVHAAAKKPAKATKKGGISPEGSAKLAANMKPGGRRERQAKKPKSQEFQIHRRPAWSDPWLAFFLTAPGVFGSHDTWHTRQPE